MFQLHKWPLDALKLSSGELLLFWLTVLDLPSVDHVEELARNRKFKEFRESINDSGFELVADFTPSYILATPEYQQLMLSLNSKMDLYLNRNTRYSYLKTVYELQARLHRINDQMHPQLK